MPLETGNYICDLVPTNPPGTDPVSQGDDHIRLLKQILLTQFPNLCDVVTATAEDLNNAGRSGMPKVTTYTTVAAAQVHTFDVTKSWYKVIITGGGGGGGDLTGAPNVSAGSAGATAIKTAEITAPTATYTLGAGGAFGADGENSLFDDGTVSLVAGAGKAGIVLSGGTLDGGTATGGDINITGGSYMGGDGSASYWGGGNGSLSGTAAYGAGGTAESDFAPANEGVQGIIVIEEY